MLCARPSHRCSRWCMGSSSIDPCSVPGLAVNAADGLWTHLQLMHALCQASPSMQQMVYGLILTDEQQGQPQQAAGPASNPAQPWAGNKPGRAGLQQAGPLDAAPRPAETQAVSSGHPVGAQPTNNHSTGPIYNQQQSTRQAVRPAIHPAGDLRQQPGLGGGQLGPQLGPQLGFAQPPQPGQGHVPPASQGGQPPVQSGGFMALLTSEAAAPQQQQQQQAWPQQQQV